MAPAREASAVGHALTLHHPLRLEHLRDSTYALDGTPTDCVNIAVVAVLGGLPSLVVSGINKGLNVGDDVTYSGTVSGALEGALLGVPSLAVSLQQGAGEWDFRDAARVAAEVAGESASERSSAADVSQRERPSRRSEGDQADRAGHAEARDDGERASRPPGADLLLDRRGGRRVDPERALGLRGDPRGIRLGDAAAVGHDGARRVLVRERSWPREGE